MAINFKRLLKLADFLDKLPRSHFNFREIILEVPKTKEVACGTVGCAIGWCPTVFPRLCKAFKPRGIMLYKDQSIVRAIGHSIAVPKRFFGGIYGTHAVAAYHLFGIPPNDAQSLFTPNMMSPADDGILSAEATPKQVAKRIRTYVKWAKASK